MASGRGSATLCMASREVCNAIAAAPASGFMSDGHRRRAGDSARARPATAARRRTSGRANGAPPLSLVREPAHDARGADGEGAHEQTDGDIFARIAEGRGEAFAELYQRYFRELYDFAARITHDRTAAADVVQTVFATVWERARSGEEVRSPRAWLYRVAHNAAIDELRRRRWTSGADGDQGFDFAALEDTGSTDPERFLIEKELAELVWSTAATLTPEEYALLDLYVRRELGPDELADQLGITTGAVYTRLSRLRSSFEEALRATLLMRRRDCAELQELVATLGPRAESPEGRDAVRAHIRSCSTCQEASGRYVTATEILASLAPVAARAGRSGRDLVEPLRAPRSGRRRRRRGERLVGAGCRLGARGPSFAPRSGARASARGRGRRARPRGPGRRRPLGRKPGARPTRHDECRARPEPRLEPDPRRRQALDRETHRDRVVAAAGRKLVLGALESRTEERAGRSARPSRRRNGHDEPDPCSRTVVLPSAHEGPRRHLDAHRAPRPVRRRRAPDPSVRPGRSRSRRWARRRGGRLERGIDDAAGIER